MSKTSPPAFSPTRLAQMREARGLSHTALAELVGVRRQEVIRWQNQASPRVPRPQMQKKLADALGVELVDLLEATTETLATLRRKHGLRQEDLAERAGLSRSTLQALETGKIATLRPEFAERLAEVLGLKADEVARAHQAGLTEGSSPDSHHAGPSQAPHLRRAHELAEGVKQLAPVLQLPDETERHLTMIADELDAEANATVPDRGCLLQLVHDINEAVATTTPSAGKQAVLRLIVAARSSLSA
ncbi:helix-turn-helix transcriptional regulator [Kribbella sp. NPDC059898]|uniref:helix-turn-helix transcriptional regulator n=1 Tax=Kribbella sp. NPDC059898 TaxID=3346995 RepID=UPI003651A4B4